MPRLRLVVPRYPYFNVYSRIPMPPLGLVMVGTVAAERGRWDVEVLDENNYTGEEDHRRLQAQRPADAVGIYGGLSSTAVRVYELARTYHSMGVPVLAGGAHVAALPEEAIANGVDVVVLGEGEEAVLEVLEALEAGRPLERVAGLACRDGSGGVLRTAPRPPLADLDALPAPDFSLLVDVRRRLRFVPVGRTRGCNFRCEFCAVHSQFGRTRWASPECTFEHVRTLWERGHRVFFFVDDNFAQDREGTVRLLKMLVRWRGTLAGWRRPRFIVQTRAQVGRDAELLRLMRRAGVTTLCIGLESPIDEDLRRMRKGQSSAELEADLAAIRRFGFYIHGMFIFGYPRADGEQAPAPGMTLAERADRYLAFIRRSRLDTIQVMKPVPLPGTDLARRLRRAGRIYPLSEVGWDKYDGNWVVFQPDPGTSAVTLQEEATRIMREFYRSRNVAKWLYIAPISPVDAAYYTARKAWELWQGYRRERRGLRAGVSRPAHLREAVRRIAADSLSAGWCAVKRRWRNACWRTGAVFLIRRWLEGFRRERFHERLQRLKSQARDPVRTLLSGRPPAE